MRVSPDGWRYKVTPIDRVINDCKRRADDAWWDGNDEEARLHEAEAKLYEDDRERGVEWVPNFQHQHFLWYLHQLGLLVLSGYGQHILMTGDDDAEDKNAPFDDVNWEWKRNEKTNIVRLLDALLGDGHCSRAWAYWKVRRKW